MTWITGVPFDLEAHEISSFHFFLSEEYVGELKALQQRWRKQGLTVRQVQRKTVLTIIDLLLGLARCHIENIWLDRSRAE